MFWMGVSVLVAFGGGILAVQASRVALDLESKGRRDDFPCDKFPKGVVKCGAGVGPTLLGSGNIGEAWLAEDFGSEDQVVVKIFTEGAHYVTGAARWRLTEEVKYECLPGKLVYEPALLGGAQRIARCLGENIDSAADGEIIYFKFEFAGNTSFALYHGRLAAKNRWTVDIARKMIKQLFEGLEALSRLPWVHHDLHPRNIMVRELEGGEPVLQIIDFGCSLPGTEEVACRVLPPGLEAWMPPEHFEGKKVCPDPNDPSKMIWPAFDLGAPASFDAYSAGLVLMSVLFTLGTRDSFVAMHKAGFVEEEGSPDGFYEYRHYVFLSWANALGDPSKAEAVKAWEKEMQDTFSTRSYKSYRAVNFTDRVVELKKPAAVEFLKKAAGLLHTDPLERPSVSSLLDTDWMRETIVANNTYALRHFTV